MIRACTCSAGPAVPTIGATLDGQDATQTGLTLYVIRLK